MNQCAFRTRDWVVGCLASTRGEKLADRIRLPLELAASAEGTTLDEMATFLGVSRRTAERQRDAIAATSAPGGTCAYSECTLSVAPAPFVAAIRKIGRA